MSGIIVLPSEVLRLLGSNNVDLPNNITEEAKRKGVRLPSRRTQTISNRVIEQFKKEIAISYGAVCEIMIEEDFNDSIDMMSEQLNELEFYPNVKEAISDYLIRACKSFESGLYSMVFSFECKKCTSNYIDKCLDIHRNSVMDLLEGMVYVQYTPRVISPSDYTSLLDYLSKDRYFVNSIIKGHYLIVRKDGSSPILAPTHMIKRDLKAGMGFNKVILEGRE